MTVKDRKPSGGHLVYVPKKYNIYGREEDGRRYASISYLDDGDLRSFSRSAIVDGNRFIFDLADDGFRFKGLEEEEDRILVLREELYFGSWKEMLKDLRDRLKGRP